MAMGDMINDDQVVIGQKALFFYSKRIQSDSTDPDEHWEVLDEEELTQHVKDFQIINEKYVTAISELPSI